MNSKGRHRDKGIVTEASCALSRKTEPSERLRTQPSILHYKARHCPGFAHRSCLEHTCPDGVFRSLPKRRKCRAPLAESFCSIPGVHITRAGAHTRKPQNC